MATTTASPLELSGTNVKERTMRGMIWRQFRRHRMALVGLLVLAGLVIGRINQDRVDDRTVYGPAYDEFDAKGRRGNVNGISCGLFWHRVSLNQPLC